ncbi:MAG: hypothetical protein ACE14P_00370 [Methanotrichaceae archaeon]
MAGLQEAAPGKFSTETIQELKDYLKTWPGQVYLLQGRCGKPITCKWKICVLEDKGRG